MKKNQYITPAIEISTVSAQTIMAGSNISLGGYNNIPDAPLEGESKSADGNDWEETDWE